MDRAKYHARWLRALTVYERQLLMPMVRTRNTFIAQAAAEYAKHQTVPQHVKLSHEVRIQNLLVPHYFAVSTYFGNLAGSQFKSRGKRNEVKRLTFMSLMQDWIRQRAQDSAAQISGTDYDDVSGAISTGIDEGLGVGEIASRITDLTGLSAWRAATIARTETNSAATFGAIEEARATSQEIGIVLQKEWLPTLDNRTRPAHAAMANYGPIGLDEKFIVDGQQMDRPGDPAGGPDNVINCRCALSLVERPN